jgi:Phosphodiester glycosidase
MTTPTIPARRTILFALSLSLLGMLIGLGVLYALTGPYGVNVLLRRGGSYWVSVSADDSRLSEAMRLALKSEAVGQAGPLQWSPIASGFEVAELAVTVDGTEVDRLLLARIDPNQYRLMVRNAPAGDRSVEDWRTQLHAAIVINGSYYSHRGEPDTPFLSDHVLLGPADYNGRQGAFVASATGAAIHDLAHENWQDSFRNAADALVSYPLLVGGDPGEHPIRPSDWLANRSFVGQDRSGRIILGTTEQAFFSLSRLSLFLRQAPLDLVLALNLDGGPVACQAIDVGQYARRFCGRWELQKQDQTLKLLTWPYGSWALPIILAAVPRAE